MSDIINDAEIEDIISDSFYFDEEDEPLVQSKLILS